MASETIAALSLVLAITILVAVMLTSGCQVPLR